MDKLFNIEDGQLFGGVRNNLFKAEGSSFAPENVVSEESSENMQLIKAAFANAQVGRSFTYLGRVYTVEVEEARSIICEPVAKANVPLVDFVDEASFASALLLIKASIERYPRDTTSDALAKARQETVSLLSKQKLNDSLEFDSLDKAVVEHNNNLIEKAKKGSPEYEEWLRKYREKRGKKIEEPSEGRQKKEQEESTKRKAAEDILKNKPAKKEEQPKKEELSSTEDKEAARTKDVIRKISEGGLSYGDLRFAANNFLLPNNSHSYFGDPEEGKLTYVPARSGVYAKTHEKFSVWLSPTKGKIKLDSVEYLSGELHPALTSLEGKTFDNMEEASKAIISASAEAVKESKKKG